MMVIVEQSVEWDLARETEILGENLSLCPLQIPHDHPGSNPGRRGGKPATNRLSYATACISLAYFPFLTLQLPSVEHFDFHKN
jgi:hypothetical protein